MPQMSPLSWIMLLFIMVLIILYLMTLVYFYKDISLQFKPKLSTKKVVWKF